MYTPVTPKVSPVSTGHNADHTSVLAMRTTAPLLHVVVIARGTTTAEFAFTFVAPPTVVINVPCPWRPAPCCPRFLLPVTDVELDFVLLAMVDITPLESFF
jgi:hypothetical protein